MRDEREATRDADLSQLRAVPAGELANAEGGLTCSSLLIG